jgi:hypothetical protein
MEKITQIILFTAILMGCRTMSPDLLYKSGAGTLYFPTYDEERVKYHTDSMGNRIIGMAPIRPDDSLSQFVNSWYSKHLYSMREPVLYNKTDKKTNIIRFTHLGTWGNPYSYRIEQSESDISITYNKTNGSGGYNTGKIIEHGTKKIDVEKWNLVISKMQSIDFWNIGTHDENMILDGEEWIFEAVIDGRYHLITRNSPAFYGGKEYAELCNLIVQIYN